jgi:hypothetical protein
MKKIFYLAALLTATTFVACEKDSVGGTATESMAGDWYCYVDAVDENDVTIPGGENYFGFPTGRTHILTYNTSANGGSEMWVDNLGVGNMSKDYADYFLLYVQQLGEEKLDSAKYYFHYGWPAEEMPGFPTFAVKSKVSIDQNAMTFKSVEAENLGEGYEWWIQKVKLDEQGDTVWANEEKTEPEMVDVLLNEEKPLAVSIEGKILPRAGHQNNGSVADSIVIFVTYKDDPWVPTDGYTRYKIHGVRYSGLVEND